MSEFANPVISGLNEIRRSWGWFLALGILFMLFGVACILGDITATLATVLFFGWLLLVSGVVALFYAFGTRTWSGFFFYLLSALLRGFTGYLLIRYPGAGAAGLTLVLASFFVVGGLFRARGSNGAVASLGLGSVLRHCFGGARDHVARADAHFEHLVHRLCHWRRPDL
jgi:uncharacterized membrane protein HdeD (DUF308 family)